MTEKIKEIVDEFLKDDNPLVFYKYRLNHTYYIKFQPLLEKHYIRVYLGVELPGYEYITSEVYTMQNGPLNDDNKGLAALIEMQYSKVEKMNSNGISIGYECYKSVINDNDKLREEIKHLEKEILTLKNSYVENYEASGAFVSAMKECQDWKDKYFQEKMDHTTTQARIVFAKKILSGESDERVIRHMDKSEL